MSDHADMRVNCQQPPRSSSPGHRKTAGSSTDLVEDQSTPLLLAQVWPQDEHRLIPYIALWKCNVLASALGQSLQQKIQLTSEECAGRGWTAKI